MLMPRSFGQTGLKLSPLGLGTVKFGRNEGVKYPQGFDIPDEDHLADLLAAAKALGVNVLDTAPAYGESEQRLGRLLNGQRDDWVIIGKAGEEFEEGQSSYNFTADHFKASLERSLKRLQTDHIDIFLIHSDGDDLDILNNDDLVQTLYGFKAQGLVKALGASTKSVYGGLRSLELFDCVMASYNPEYQDEKPVLDEAAALDKGVLLKKVLGSGHLGVDALPFALSHDCEPCAIVGTINIEHLKENVESTALPEA